MNEEMKTQVKATEVPHIVRVIDGAVYTVNIYFKTDAKETVQDKIKRLIRNEIVNESFSD